MLLAVGILLEQTVIKADGSKVQPGHRKRNGNVNEGNGANCGEGEEV